LLGDKQNRCSAAIYPSYHHAESSGKCVCAYTSVVTKVPKKILLNGNITTVANSIAESCCEVCWLSSGSSLVMASSLWPLSEPFSVNNFCTSVGCRIYYLWYYLQFWIMATQSTHPFSYRYLIQLLMQPTLKVLKCFNCHLHSSQNLLMKPERLYAIIFDAVYGSLTLSYLLFTLDTINIHYSMGWDTPNSFDTPLFCTTTVLQILHHAWYNDRGTIIPC